MKASTSTSSRVKQLESMDVPTRCQKSWPYELPSAACIFCPSCHSLATEPLDWSMIVVVPRQQTHITTASEKTPKRPVLAAGCVRSSTKLTSFESS